MKEYLKYDTIDDSLGYLYGRNFICTKLITSKLYKMSNMSDMTPEQMGILLRLKEQDGLTQTEIADKTIKHKPSITRIIDLMEKKELVERRNDKDDRRKYKIFLTEKGLEFATKLKPITFKLLEELFEGFTQEEIMVLKMFLTRMYVNINKMMD